MNYEELLLIPATGFTFDVPVPLPLLGHKLIYPLNIGPFRALVHIELANAESQRLGAMTISSSGLIFHERDRFGLYAHSKVQLRFNCDFQSLASCHIIDLMRVPEQQGIAFPKPGFLAYLLCANAFNYFVDLHTISFETHWIPHVTPEDIHSMALMDWWTNPKEPKSIGVIAGHPFGQRMVFGQPENMQQRDPNRTRHVLKHLPLRLWEEVFHNALRDFEVGRSRSAAMHACLGVECYMRAVLAENAANVADGGFLGRALKALATRRTCLPSLLGYSLDSQDAPSYLREAYVIVSALRDTVMHTGEVRYRTTGEHPEVVDLTDVAVLADHVDKALSLVHSIDAELAGKGFVSLDRGMVPRNVLREYFADDAVGDI
jgi:hypothetical protein